jgi:hypothetical protein
MTFADSGRRDWPRAFTELKTRCKADKPNNSDYFVTMTTTVDKSKRAMSASADTAGLEALVARAARAGKGAAPVEKWNPAYCGELDIEIRSDGTWFYLGTPIGRAALVRLFSTVLRKDEDGRTYLVTPVEKIAIRVEDAPFIAVELDASMRGESRVLTFRTNVGDVVEAGPQNPLRFDEEAETGGLKPYLLVRGRLEALVGRSVTHELLALGEEIEVEGRRMFALRSNGAVFPVMPADRLDEMSA